MLKYTIKWQFIYHQTLHTFTLIFLQCSFCINPQVCKDDSGGGALHILEFIEDLQPLENWSELGRQVASLHTFNSSLLQRISEQQSNINGATKGSPVEKFGFHTPTYLGNFTPGAVWRDTWVVSSTLGVDYSLFEVNPLVKVA